MKSDLVISREITARLHIPTRTFAEHSDATESAWHALFPKQMGYFTHPIIAPQRSTLSVYHYLHCLVGNKVHSKQWRQDQMLIRCAAYRMGSERATGWCTRRPWQGEKLDVDSLPMAVSPPHIRHCIDLLRQALMCSPGPHG